VGVVPRHAVELYLDDAELTERVGRFVVAGFDACEPVLLVATPAHITLFKEALAALGWGEERVAREQTLLIADAQSTLERILVDGQPSPDLFGQIIGALLDDAEAGGQHPPRVYGEMVDVTHSAGDTATAIRLEELWNELGETRAFSLLCGYRIDILDHGELTTAVPEICRLHSRVDVSYDSERLSTAVGLAMAEVLGATKAAEVYYIVGNRLNDDHMPLSQRALMWVGGYSDEIAKRVVDRTRARYHGDVAARPAIFPRKPARPLPS
jgi:hypothetical protein